MGSSEPLSKTFHDLRNSLGSILLNLEVSADPSHASGIALEAAQDALREAKNLEGALARLRSQIEGRS